ncbi:MAG: penicillin-binding protein 2 [Candidatus Omnitrophota bacterium]
MRLKIFFITLSLMFLLVLLRLAYMQLIMGGYYRQLSAKNCIRLIARQARRGTVYDRNGIILAENLPSYDVVIIPQDFQEPEAGFVFLSRALQKDRQELVKHFRLNRNAPFAPVVVAKNISREQAIKIEENKNQYPGISVQVNAKRAYPLASVSSHILGYVGEIDRFRITRLKDYGYKLKDMVGYGGIEEYYDNFLRGEDGGVQIVVDNRGRQVRMLGMRSPTAGKDIRLTIDARIQKICAEALSGFKGAAIFMDPKNGEILGMVSSPAFDPNVFVERYAPDLLSGYFQDQQAPLLNRAVSGLYAPGSVFKVVTALAALEQGKVSAVTSFFCNGSYQLGNRQFACTQKHGLQDLRLAFAHSCNVYFYHLGRLAGPEALSRLAYELGFGQTAGLDLPAQAQGIIPSPIQKRMARKENWYPGDTLNFSIGQGELLVTPLQLTIMMATVVNGTFAARPHLVKEVAGRQPAVIGRQKRLKIKPQNLEIVRRDLRAVVSEPTGTAHILNIENLKVAGKTGTAQVGQGRPHAWFVGFFPYQEPKMVFAVFLENGGSGYNACVVAREILRRMVEEKIL